MSLLFLRQLMVPLMFLAFWVFVAYRSGRVNRSSQPRH